MWIIAQILGKTQRRVPVPFDRELHEARRVFAAGISTIRAYREPTVTRVGLVVLFFAGCQMMTPRFRCITTTPLSCPVAAGFLGHRIKRLSDSGDHAFVCAAIIERRTRTLRVLCLAEGAAT